MRFRKPARICQSSCFINHGMIHDTDRGMNELPRITDKHETAGLLWLSDHREQWGLSEAELATLLGVTAETIRKWLSTDNKTLKLPADVVDRIGLLLGLHKSLVLLTPFEQERMAFEWFRKPIYLWGLNGISIRTHLLDASHSDVLVELVRRIRSATV